MKLIDSHCHIDNEKFNEDRNDVVLRIKKELEFAVNIGYDFESSLSSVKLSEENNNIFATVGFHPCDIDKMNDSSFENLKKLAQKDKVVAIGEIGLDYYWEKDKKEEQKIAFIKQIELAISLNKPVVIHSRDAMSDTIEILKQYPKLRGIFHCYPGSYESAKELMDRFYFGIGGVVTFKNGKKTKETVSKLPLDRIVLETDSPYLTPSPYRGKRNEPIYVKYVAEEIAKIKNISLEEVIKTTNFNTKKAYDLR